jgi:hypothetical protein
MNRIGPLARGESGWAWPNFAHRLPALLGIFLGFLYLIYFSVSVRERGWLEYWAIDFRAFYSSGVIARQYGFASVYDLSVQAEVQQQVRASFPGANASAPVDTVPTPYLPVFIAPFYLLSFLAPAPALAIWLLLNAGGFGGYVLMRSRTRPPGGSGPWWLVLLSLPAFLTFAFAQVNAILAIAFAEAVRSSNRGRAAAVGLWLGLLLVKPQSLVLVIPGLVLARRGRTLVGFGLAALSAGSVSLALSGWDGLQGLAKLLIQYPAGLASTYPESMMSWRAVGENLRVLLPESFAWGLTLVGLVLTAAAGLLPFARKDQPEASIGRPMVIALAGGLSVAWHSHVHTALAVGLGWMATEPDTTSRKMAMSIWTLLPAFVFVALAIGVDPGLAHRVAGLTTLGANLGVMGWMAHAARAGRPQ